jgi:hypothetical protein
MPSISLAATRVTEPALCFRPRSAVQGLLVDNSLVLAVEPLAAVMDLAEIDPA